MKTSIFASRKEAGELLATKLIKLQKQKDTIILALARGGIVIGSILAKKLALPLDIISPRKVIADIAPELALGAVCEEEIFLNEDLITDLAVTKDFLKNLIQKAKDEEKRRDKLYHQDFPSIERKGKTIVLVDDGIATGATFYVTVQALKKHHPKKIIIATPIASQQSFDLLQKQADEIIYLHMPESFFGISQFYADFPQVTDNEVLQYLQKNS